MTSITVRKSHIMNNKFIRSNLSGRLGGQLVEVLCELAGLAYNHMLSP